MTANEIMVILDRHTKWLRNKKDGCRADLCGADLRGADLCGADLRGAVLCGADLCRADLCGADLCRADLCRADLCGADLRGADLRGADLRGADLRGAVLCGADLRDVENLPDLSWTSIVPGSGAFIGWKKVRRKIIKLEILEDAKRSNATGRKCRCSAAKVLEIQNIDGSRADVDSITNTDFNPHVTYTVGEVVYPDSFNDDRWNECSHGIHFFITRKEAVDY